MRLGGAAAAMLLGGLVGVTGCDAGPGVPGIARPWPAPGVGSPSGDDPVASPEELVQPHAGAVLPLMNLSAVYIGDEGVDGVGNRDNFLSWVVTSSGYWTRLAQYGVRVGIFVGSSRVATTAFFTVPEVAAGSVTETELADAVASYGPNVPVNTNAVIFFMPTSIGVSVGGGGPQRNCTAFSGYHDFVVDSAGNTKFLYAIVFPCPSFPPDMPSSHELVEMVTNPVGAGWYDPQNGEEIGDLCNFPVSQPINLWSPSRFWSNADGACVPP